MMNNFINSLFYEYIGDQDISDEAIFVLHRFLSELACKFEQAANYRINRHIEEVWRVGSENRESIEFNQDIEF